MTAIFHPQIAPAEQAPATQFPEQKKPASLLDVSERFVAKVLAEAGIEGSRLSWKSMSFIREVGAKPEEGNLGRRELLKVSPAPGGYKIQYGKNIGLPRGQEWINAVVTKDAPVEIAPIPNGQKALTFMDLVEVIPEFNEVPIHEMVVATPTNHSVTPTNPRL